jgi:uncharacterized protein YfaT (DUF1175 family)
MCSFILRSLKFIMKENGITSSYLRSNFNLPNPGDIIFYLHISYFLNILVCHMYFIYHLLNMSFRNL